MATDPIRLVEFSMMGGEGPLVLRYPEAAGQTFLRGAIVTRNPAGYIIECTSPNPAQILGVADADGQNTATAGLVTTPVVIADDVSIFRGNVSPGQVTALSDVGGIYGLVKQASGLWTIDKTAVGASGRVIIVQLDPDDLVGDTQGRLLFFFRQPYTMLFVTS